MYMYRLNILNFDIFGSTLVLSHLSLFMLIYSVHYKDALACENRSYLSAIFQDESGNNNYHRKISVRNSRMTIVILVALLHLCVINCAFTKVFSR